MRLNGLVPRMPEPSAVVQSLDLHSICDLRVGD
jgi:hypothetical protein